MFFLFRQIPAVTGLRLGIIKLLLLLLQWPAIQCVRVLYEVYQFFERENFIIYFIHYH